MIENRRTVIIFDYTNGDIVQLVHTEIGTKERGTLVGRTKPGGGDIYQDRNVVHDDFHELSGIASPKAQPIDRRPCGAY